MKQSCERCADYQRDSRRPPKNKCLNCWFCYFYNNRSVVAACLSIHKNFGDEQLEKVVGKHFKRFFLEFKKTMPAHLTAQYAAEKTEAPE